MKKVEIKNIEPDYIQSSNTVFNFMKKPEFLEKALEIKALCPRLYDENVEYLNLMNGEKQIRTITVLQKCFCDVPLHHITEHFPLSINDYEDLDDNVLQQLKAGSTHTDFYGEYGIGFSKRWAQNHNLQPVQYINPKSTFAIQFKDTFQFILDQEDIDDIIVSDVIARLAYFKPLVGVMPRTIVDKSINILKNFHDECEWRFVPRQEVAEKYQICSVYFNEELKKLSSEISNRLTEEKYRELWLNFDFQDIKYLIVPDSAARMRLIDYIMALNFGSADEIKDKYLLISKILVLEGIKRDF